MTILILRYPLTCDQLDVNGPSLGAVKFEQEQSLPAAKIQATVDYRQAKMRSGERTEDVRLTVGLTLLDVMERPMLGEKPAGDAYQVVTEVRLISRHKQCRGRVLDKHECRAGLGVG
jgi:hypothetical protein